MIRIVAAIIAVGMGILVSGDLAVAGEPLYRYALRQGSAAPYEIYNLSREAPSGSTLLFHEKVHQAASASSSRLNLTFSYVNVAANPRLTGLPLTVRNRWLETSTPTLPLFQVFSPHGRVIFEGMLGVDDVKATAESTFSAKLVKQLSANDGVALVLISGVNSAAQDQALAEQLQRLLRDLRVEQTAGPADDAAPLAVKLPTPLKVGFFHFEKKPSTRDLCERAMAGLLPSGEADQTDPAVMVVFGRGRALPVRVGVAITPKGLLSDFAMLLSPFDPADNHPMPGTNLLLRADWDKVEKTVRQRWHARDIVQASATEEISPQAGGSGESESPAQSIGQPHRVEKPTQVSTIAPAVDASPDGTATKPIDFERVTVLGIVVAMIGLLMLTVSIIRPQ